MSRPIQKSDSFRKQLRKIKDDANHARKFHNGKDKRDHFLTKVPEDYIIVMNPNSKAFKYRENLKITGLSALESNIGEIYESLSKIMVTIDKSTNPQDRFLDCLKWLFVNFERQLETFMDSCHLGDETLAKITEKIDWADSLSKLRINSDHRIESTVESLSLWSLRLFKFMRLLKNQDIMLNDLIKEYAFLEEDHRTMVDVISQFQTKNSRIPITLTVKKEYHVIQKAGPTRVHHASMNFPEDIGVQTNENSDTLTQQYLQSSKQGTSDNIKKARNINQSPNSENPKFSHVITQTDSNPVRSIGTNTIKYADMYTRVKVDSSMQTDPLDFIPKYPVSSTTVDGDFSSKPNLPNKTEIVNENHVFEAANIQNAIEPTFATSFKGVARKGSIIFKLVSSNMGKSYELEKRKKTICVQEVLLEKNREKIHNLERKIQEGQDEMHRIKRESQEFIEAAEKMRLLLKESQLRELQAYKKHDTMHHDLHLTKEQMSKTKNELSDAKSQYAIKSKMLKEKEDEALEVAKKVKEIEQELASSTEKFSSLMNRFQSLEKNYQELDLLYASSKIEHDRSKQELEDTVKLMQNNVETLKNDVKILMKFPDPSLNPGIKILIPESVSDCSQLDEELQNYISANTLRIGLLEGKNTEFRKVRMEIVAKFEKEMFKVPVSDPQPLMNMAYVDALRGDGSTNPKNMDSIRRTVTMANITLLKAENDGTGDEDGGQAKVKKKKRPVTGKAKDGVKGSSSQHDISGSSKSLGPASLSIRNLESMDSIPLNHGWSAETSGAWPKRNTSAAGRIQPRYPHKALQDISYVKYAWS